MVDRDYLLEEKVSDRVSEYRWKHIQGVISTAVDLAKECSVNQQKAYLAALFHDIAREYSSVDLLNQCQTYNIDIDPQERLYPILLHAKLGAYIAYNDFGVSDVDVLQAIRAHTYGSVSMTLLDEILFLADAIEPGRHIEWRQPIVDTLSQSGMKSAMIQCISNTIFSLLKKRQQVHPVTIQMYNSYVQSKSK